MNTPQRHRGGFNSISHPFVDLMYTDDDGANLSLDVELLIHPPPSLLLEVKVFSAIS
jgi:hypothetical protein